MQTGMISIQKEYDPDKMRKLVFTSTWTFQYYKGRNLFIALFFVNIIFLSLFFLFYLMFCPVIKEAKKSLKIAKG